MTNIVAAGTSSEVSASAISHNLAPEDVACLSTIAEAYKAHDQRPLPDTTPTADNIRAAVNTLRDELLGQFSPSWRQNSADEMNDYEPQGFANAAAMVIQPIAQPFIRGATPLYWVKNDGAEDFVEVVSSLYFPKPVVRVKWRGDEAYFSESIVEGLKYLPSVFRSCVGCVAHQNQETEWEGSSQQRGDLLFIGIDEFILAALRRETVGADSRQGGLRLALSSSARYKRCSLVRLMGVLPQL